MDDEEFIKIIRKVKPSIEELNPDTPIRDIGLSSLDIMIIICEIEKKYNQKICIEQLKEASTLRELYMAADSTR